MHNIENVHVLLTHCHNYKYSYSVMTIQMSTYYNTHIEKKIILPLQIQYTTGTLIKILEKVTTPSNWHIYNSLSINIHTTTHLV